MTLILAAVTERTAVISSDGFEFEHLPGRAGKVLKASNRTKLLQLGHIPVVLAVHGQNRIARQGRPLESQELVIDVLTQMAPLLCEVPTVEGIAARLLKLLAPDVLHTFTLLERLSIHTSRLAICVFGMANSDSRQRGAEATWPMLTSRAQPSVERLVQLSDTVRILHAGTGAKFVEPIVRNPRGRFHPNRLSRPKPSDLQRYVRGAYESAAPTQPDEQREFGGTYQEFTIHNGKCSDTTPASL